jgi:hypothetical protein
MCYQEKDRKIAHLEKVREDIRDEIKKRIEQRDKYSIQLTIALSAIIALAFSKPDYSGVLIVAPLVSIYFTILIMYSYKIHRAAARYLREKIEPELAFLCGTEVSMEWETYYKKNNVPGIRHWFFLLMMIVITAISLTYLWSVGKLDCSILIVATVVYVIFMIWIFIWRIIEYFKEKKFENERK